MSGVSAEHPAVPKTAEEVPKLSVLEEDDEFDEFEVEDWDEGNENKLDIEQWEADWDDDDLEDQFSIQLRNELQGLAANVNAAAGAASNHKTPLQ